jgi:dipeptidyl aminopeptidase/acylaminoacyl peptidase
MLPIQPYQKKQARKAEVYIINADGSGLTALTSNSAADLSPAWSPDGTKIVFSSDRDGGDHHHLYTMDADGSDVAQVTNARWAVEPDWQPLTAKSRSLTVHPPDTGGPSLILVASALLFSGGVLFYAVVKRSM